MPRATSKGNNDRIEALQKDVTEMQTVLWGANRSNGLAGTVKELMGYAETIEKRFDEFLEERPSICIGKAALEEYVKKLKEGQENMVSEKQFAELVRHNRTWALLTVVGVVVMPVVMTLINRFIK